MKFISVLFKIDILKKKKKKESWKVKKLKSNRPTTNSDKADIIGTILT